MHIREYQVTHDRNALGGPTPTIPYPDPDRIASLLDDPTIQRILPTTIRLPLRLEPANTAGAFALDGLPPEIMNPSRERVWGSYSAGGAQATGDFDARPVTARLAYLEFEIAGYLSEGLSLKVRNPNAGKARQVIPTDRIDSRWRTAYRRVSAGSWTVLAEDHSREGWFAFREPRERGQFSYYALQLLNKGVYFVIGGAAAFVAYALLLRVSSK
jgi:hypothetical protein